MSIVLMGSTSGSITLSEPAVAGSNTISLPALTGIVVVAGQNSAITAGTAVASTSGTSIDFTSIPSWVKRITVMFQGVSTSGTSIPLVQLGVSGTPTTSGYLGASTSSTPGSANYTTGFGLGTNSAANIVHGNLTITNITGNSWTASGTLAASNAAGGWYFSGSVALAGTANMIRITTVNGTDTFDSGSINILYE